jgi:hypothetical protein
MEMRRPTTDPAIRVGISRGRSSAAIAGFAVGTWRGDGLEAMRIPT